MYNPFKRYLHYLVKQALDEVLKEPEINLIPYYTKLFNDKKTLWNTLITQKVDYLQFKVEYLDENNHKREYIVRLNNVGEMKEYFENDWKSTIQSDLVSIISVNLYCWYLYKGTKELVSYRFTQFNKNYRPDMLEECFKYVQNWCNNNPEVFL